MHNQTRTNEGGSVVSFLVVGVILTALVLGGIFFVQQRNQGPEVAVSPSPIPSSTPSSSQTANPSPSKSPSPSPSSSPKPSSSPVPSSHPTTGTAPTANLPTTGPVEDIIALTVPSALLMGTTVAYIRSRKTRLESFRR